LGQQEFGRSLLDEHGFVLIPSVVSAHSWNLVADPGHAALVLAPVYQDRFALDPRLPPRST
jgi:RES domain-containing protein